MSIVSLMKLFQQRFSVWSIIFTLTLVFLHFNTCESQNPTCRPNQFKYSFTECDSYGGRWRVWVPTDPNCVPPPHIPSLNGTEPLKHVDGCYTSCRPGHYYNISSLLCEQCPPGHYSLGGGLIIDTFNGSSGQLSSGFRIETESTKHTPGADHKCVGWRIDPVTNHLISTLQSATKDGTIDDVSGGCLSELSYTVKVVKPGRLRFTYQYRTPDDLTTSLLFTFHYKLYPSETSNNENFKHRVLDEEDFTSTATTGIRFPPPTQGFDTVELHLTRHGLYVFTWRTVVIGNIRNFFTSSSSIVTGSLGRFSHFDSSSYDDSDHKWSSSSSSSSSSLFRDSITGVVRLKKIIIEGVAYASECALCEPGTYASQPGTDQCLACPANTAYSNYGAISCVACDPHTEYSSRGATQCSKRPVCGPNDYYYIPVSRCDPVTRKQKVEYRWIEPRICIDSKQIFPPQASGTLNCSVDANGGDDQNGAKCDLGMELRSDAAAGGAEYCQFCPKGYFRDEQSTKCKPCPPFTSPYYALSVFRWNSSLIGWSKTNTVDGHRNSTESTSVKISDDYFDENSAYANAFFSRQCIRPDDETDDNAGVDLTADTRASSSSYNTYAYSKESDQRNAAMKIDECDPRIAWQPFTDHIRTGASALLDSYLILSLNVPGFRSTLPLGSGGVGELSFVFETHCADGDRCVLLFVETKNDESDLRLQEYNNNNAMIRTNVSSSRSQFMSQQTINTVIKEWSQSTGYGERLSYRHKIERNISISYSWVFKRSTSFQSYAKLYSIMLTNSLAGGAIECNSCPFQQLSTTTSDSTDNNNVQCVACPPGTYLDIPQEQIPTSEKMRANFLNSLSKMPTITDINRKYKCKRCAPNHVLSTNYALPLGNQLCLACGPNLITDHTTDDDDQRNGGGGGVEMMQLCYSNCTVRFVESDANLTSEYDLRELPHPLHYKGGNMFTASGTQYLHLFHLSLCGHPLKQRSTSQSTCLNNITSFGMDASSTTTATATNLEYNFSGVRSYICRSTIIPDGPAAYTTQSINLGDELIGITRDATFGNISVHKDFLQPSSNNGINNQHRPFEQYHLYYVTKSSTVACPNGRQSTVTMRCAPELEKSSPGKATLSTPNSCPDGTCDGCTYHFLIETGTAAACRLCRPYSTKDFDTLIGECINGQQLVHFINPHDCVLAKKKSNTTSSLSSSSSSSVVYATNDMQLQRPCTVLLPPQVQVGIVICALLGMFLILLVFHFWNRNRSLEYKYHKLINEGMNSKGNGDDDEEFDNCCAENTDEEDHDMKQSNSTATGGDQQNANNTNSLHQQLVFSNNNNNFDRSRNIPKSSRNNNTSATTTTASVSSNTNTISEVIIGTNRVGAKKKATKLGSSREMQQLFGTKKSSGNGSGGGGGRHHHQLDDEGYETIHLTSAMSIDSNESIA